MKHVIGIDLGTSSIKAVIFDQAGNVIASEQKSYPIIQPANGWAEQDPSEWVNASVKVLETLVRKSNIKPIDIISIGIAGQMHGIVLLDKDDKVLRNAIIWCDQRTEKQCIELNNHFGDELIEITGNPALTGFSLSKLLWVKQNEPQIYKKIKKVLLPKDYLRFCLTSEFASEYSDASGMQLLNLKTHKYDKKILDYIELDIHCLPKLYESYEATGHLTKEVAAKLGLSSKTLVVGGASDNAAAALGSGAISDQDTFLTLGSSGVLYMHIKHLVYDTKGRFHTFCSAMPKQYHIMGVTQGAGTSLEWLKDNIFSFESVKYKSQFFAWLFEEVESIPIGANKLIFLPYLLGERTPHLDPNARGVFFGLSAIHNKLDMAKAVVEGITLSILDCQRCFIENNITFDNLTITGGGAQSEIWCQMFADCLGVEIKTLLTSEGPALGVGMLAFVGAKVYKDINDAKAKMIKYSDKIYVPNMQNHKQYQKVFAIYQKLYQQTKDLFVELAQL